MTEPQEKKPRRKKKKRKFSYRRRCPACGSPNLETIGSPKLPIGRCRDCGETWADGGGR